KGPPPTGGLLPGGRSSRPAGPERVEGRRWRPLVAQRVAHRQHLHPRLAAVEGDLVAGGVEEAGAGERVRLRPGAGDGDAVLEDDRLAAADGAVQQVSRAVAGGAGV